MKKNLFTTALSICITVNMAIAQWNGASTTTTGDIYREGAVGIGTTTTPAAKLDLNFYNGSGSIPQYGLLLNTNSFGTGTNADNSYYLKALDKGNGAVGFIIKGNGLVGINTATPLHALDVRGNMYTTGSMIVDGGDLILARTTNDYGFVVRPNIAGKKNLAFAVEGGGALDLLHVNSGLSLFTGSIGIGTADFNPATYKLAVEGKIGARGVKVTLTNPFPDYVFESTYKLRPLANLQKYIDQNKHLPGIPSAEEVKKDGGIELGEMNVKLLEKIEELTLYVIQLKKEIEELKKQKEH